MITVLLKLRLNTLYNGIVRVTVSLRLWYNVFYCGIVKDFRISTVPPRSLSCDFLGPGPYHLRLLFCDFFSTHQKKIQNSAVFQIPSRLQKGIAFDSTKNFFDGGAFGLKLP